MNTDVGGFRSRAGEQWFRMLLAAAAILATNFAVAMPVLADGETASVSGLRAFVQAYSQNSAWDQLVTSHWRTALGTYWFDALKRGPVSPGGADIADVSVVSSTADHATVDYRRVSPGGRPGSLQRAYLVNEQGRWLMDNPFGGTPEWAVDKKDLQVFRQVRTEEPRIIAMEFSRDVAKIPQFVASDSVLEYGLDLIRRVMLRSPRLLSVGPVSITVRGAGLEGVIPYRRVDAYYPETVRNGQGRPETQVVTQTDVLAYEGGHWKTIYPGLNSSENVVSRFLQLWKDNRRDLLARFLAPDAPLYLKNGARWRLAYELGNLPSLAKVDGMVVRPNSDENRTGGPPIDRCDVELKMGDERGLMSSGLYTFEVSKVTRFGQPYARISAIRYFAGK